MSNRILIIGGTGLLGMPVARKLKNAVYIVRALVKDTAKAKESFSGDYTSMVAPSYITEKAISDWMRAFKKIGELAIHLKQTRYWEHQK